MLFHFAGHAWYIHGMSADAHREKMPNYLLQWEAIQTAANLGCKTYDLWGAPDAFDESDEMWGVLQVQRRFGWRSGAAYRRLGFSSPAKALSTLYADPAKDIRIDASRRSGAH